MRSRLYIFGNMEHHTNRQKKVSKRDADKCFLDLQVGPQVGQARCDLTFPGSGPKNRKVVTSN